MKLLIFGATGKTGRHVIEQGLAQGHHITVFVRNPAALRARNNFRVAQGELFDREKIREAMKNQDAVISTLGNKTSATLWKKNMAISKGLANIIGAMEECGVKRIILVTSFGVNKKIFWPEKLFIKIVLKNIFADIPRQELLLQKSTLRWTIIRPARLANGPRTGCYRSGEDLPINLFSKISRADVADFLLKSVREPDTIGKIITISNNF